VWAVLIGKVYTGRAARCLLVIKVYMLMGQTDGQTPDHYITLSAMAAHLYEKFQFQFHKILDRNVL